MNNRRHVRRRTRWRPQTWAVAYTADGAALIAADTGSEALVWDADWRSWPERVCEWLAGRDVESSWEKVMGKPPTTLLVTSADPRVCLHR